MGEEQFPFGKANRVFSIYFLKYISFLVETSGVRYWTNLTLRRFLSHTSGELGENILKL